MKTGLIHEFKEFVVKGNMPDFAVGALIGASFSELLRGLIRDGVLPLIAFARSAGAMAFPTDGLLSFGGSVVQFLLTSAAVFLTVRVINSVRKGEEREPEGKECPHCCTSIAVDATRCPHCTTPLEGFSPLFSA